MRYIAFWIYTFVGLVFATSLHHQLEARCQAGLTPAGTAIMIAFWPVLAAFTPEDKCGE
jgi:hypothetical protein